MSHLLEQLIRSSREEGERVKPIFVDRIDAAKRLAPLIAERDLSDSVMVGIMNGGAPMVEYLSSQLHLPMIKLPVTKIRIPFDPRFGIGAMTDDIVIFDGDLVSFAGLNEADLASWQEEARVNLVKRERKIQGIQQISLSGKTALIIDDGVASGYTVLAASAFLKRNGAHRLVVVTPVISKMAVYRLQAHEIEVVTLHEVEAGIVVDNFYENFPEIGDEG